MKQETQHLALALATLLLLVGHLVESASIWQRIPGAELLKDMTLSTIDTLYDTLDESLAGLLEKTSAREKLDNCLGRLKDPDTKRNVSEIIRSRGFLAEEYDILTKDGYYLVMQRIVNPLVDPSYRARMKPVIMQHGIISSSVDWVINSRHVKPARYPAAPRGAEGAAPEGEQPDERGNEIEADQVAKLRGDSQEHPNALGFYLANKGYDVFLANSRGNIYGQRSTKYERWDLKFWDFTYDEQIQYDLPEVIEFVRKLTNHTKVAYVGHSQGTTIMFGLLSEKPEYADIVEPVIALAPVAYVHNSISPAKYFSLSTPVLGHINIWFATNSAALKYLGPIICGPKMIRRDICANLFFLLTGFDLDELDDERLAAYMAHMPSGTSLKNLAHYGQGVLTGRFAKFDHGTARNLALYGQASPPDYKLERIRSKSIVLFVADNDWLSSPRDVARLRSELKVKPIAVYNITEYVPKWNHIDFVYGKHAGELINKRIFDVMEKFKSAEK